MRDILHELNEMRSSILVLSDRLDDASCSVFKENVRLNKALGYHIKEVEDLQKRNAALAEENDILSLHKVTPQLFCSQFLLLFSKDA